MGIGGRVEEGRMEEGRVEEGRVEEGRMEEGRMEGWKVRGLYGGKEEAQSRMNVLQLYQDV